MSQAVSNAYKEGNVEDGEIKEGAPGSSSNPIQTQVSNSTAEDILKGVDLNDIITQGEFTQSTINQLLGNLASDPISGNLGAKAIHNNLAPSNANNIRVNENGDLIIPDTYAFRPLGHENNKITKAYANIVDLLGGDKEAATKDMATILDQSIGSFLNFGQGILNTVLGTDDSFLTDPLGSAKTGGFVPGRNDPGVQYETTIPKAQLLEILKRGNNKIPRSEKAIEALENLTSEQKNEILKSMGMEDPTSEENFQSPSWFTFSSRTPDGRIFGYNHSGAFGELKLGSGGGERGSMESGYGTKGYDMKTNTGGTSWTMDYDARPGDTSKGGASEPKPDPKSKPDKKKDYEKNRDKQRKFRFNNSYKSKGDILSEVAKLGHFEPDQLNVNIEDLRKGIMPEFPEEAPPELINGYSSKSRLAPKTIEGEPFLKITKKDLAKNHRLKDSEIKEFMKQIDAINKYIKQNPAQLIHAQQRYPKDDPRLAELNWKMDQMLGAGKEFMNKHYPENQKLFTKIQKTIKKNIELTDPKTFKGVKVPKFEGVDLTDYKRRKEIVSRHYKKAIKIKSLFGRKKT